MADRKKKSTYKADLLAELVERYTYWSSIGTDEATEYAAAYERMICMFTTPEEDNK